MSNIRKTRWRRVKPEKERARHLLAGSILGKVGITRTVDKSLVPPHFRHQLDKFNILHIKCFRVKTFDGFVLYKVHPYIMRLKSRKHAPSKSCNWINVPMHLKHHEIMTLSYYLSAATDWITKQVLLDHEWERQQKAKIDQIAKTLNKNEDEQRIIGEQIDAAIEKFTTKD